MRSFIKYKNNIRGQAICRPIGKFFDIAYPQKKTLISAVEKWNRRKKEIYLHSNIHQEIELAFLRRPVS